jgi:hypothetical protein
MLSCCQKDLQIHLTGTGESGAEHSRHLKQSLGVWSGLHGTDWYIEARVKNITDTCLGQQESWLRLSPASTRSITSNSKNAKILYTIPVKRIVSAWRHMRLNSIPTTQIDRMAIPSGH